MIQMLFVPANDERKIKKALKIKADMDKNFPNITFNLIFDLEDSVPYDAVDVGLKNIVEFADREHWVRVNVNSLKGDAYNTLASRKYGVVLAKATKSMDFSIFDRSIALIESQLGLTGLDEIIEKVDGIMFGKADLAAYMDSDEYEDFARKHIAIKANSCGKVFIDCPACSLDTKKIAAAAKRAYDYGYSGIAMLHPYEIPVIIQNFRPSKEKFEWAQKVLRLLKYKHVAILDDEVIGPPTKIRALNIVNDYERSIDWEQQWK